MKKICSMKIFVKKLYNKITAEFINSNIFLQNFKFLNNFGQKFALCRTLGTTLFKKGN